MCLKYFLSTVSILFICSTPAIAQNWNTWSEVPLNSGVQNTIWDSLRNQVNSGAESSSSLDLLTLGAIDSNLTRADLEFAVDPEVRQSVLSTFFEAAAEEYPELAMNMSQSDVFAAIDNYLHKYGLSSHNFADAMTIYLIELHGAATGNINQPNLDVVAGVRSQTINIVAQAATPEELANPSAMQSASDELLLRTLFVNVLNSNAIESGNSQISQDVALMTKQEFGADFSQLALNNNGLTRIKR